MKTPYMKIAETNFKFDLFISFIEENLGGRIFLFARSASLSSGDLSSLTELSGGGKVKSISEK